jgi:acetolactate synthase I/II/III large subunit
LTIMTNADLLVHMLEDAGVRWVFGIPSGPVLPLIESLRQSSVDFVLTASETSAGFMASVVGYLTGIPGVCASTVGPGATNLTTGIGCAWLDRCPALAVTCNVASPWLQRRIQMRIDHHALFKPLTKASFSLRNGRVSATLMNALEIATQEPPGPVHLDLPEDIAQAKAVVAEILERDSNQIPDLASEVTEAVGAALKRARRPLLVTGLTLTRSKVASQLLQFIGTQEIPFVSTLHAKGFLPENHANWVGVIGRARRTDVKAFTDRADLIIAIGYDPIEINYEEWVGKTPVIHASTEAAEVGQGLSFFWNKACDLDKAINALAELPKFANDWSKQKWQEHRVRQEGALRPSGSDFAVHQVIDILREKLPPDGILACDVGAHTHQVATQWRTHQPKTLLATNGWSSMGYGMPAAYAAKLVFPGRCVVAVVGDGCFQMTAGELALARRLNLAVPIVVLNDGWLGLMKIKQERRNYPLSGVFLGDPPESPGQYFGVPCRAAKTPEAFQDALDWGFALGGPSVIEAFISVGSYSATVFD